MKTILVVEDDRIMRENMAELLSLVGYKVEVAQDGKEGVEKAEHLIPDLIICDIKMPVLDGFGVLHILSKKPETAGIPFIFVTAKTDRNDLRKGMEMGADDFLTKPFEDTELLKAVETRLNKNDIPDKEFSDDAKGFSDFVKEANMLDGLKSISDELQPEEYKAKDMIFETGKYPYFLFLVESGVVKTFRLNTDGKEFISNIYQPGDFFGYRPILENRVYNESAQALELCQILKIPGDDFLSLIYKNRDIAYKLIKLISKNLSEKEEALIHLAYDSVRKRVAIKLSELIGDKENGSISISRADLAAMVGTSTETLVRTLTELKDLQIIDTTTHSIVILDKNKLLNFSRAW
jgi:CheY-like chemotaxis protein/CRP-like cAMP-binding protein